MNFARWLFLVLLALPLATYANPTRLTTHMTGSMTPNPIALSHIGLDSFWDFTGDSLPFEVTMSASFDPDRPGSDVDEHDARIQVYSTDIAVTLSVGGETFDFTSDSSAALISTGSSTYLHEVAFYYGSYYVFFEARVFAPQGTVGGLPLTPRTIGPGPGITGDLRITTMPAHLDIPGQWSSWGTGQSASVQVASMVPEPRHASMVGAGLAVLACLVRRRRAVLPM